MESPVKQTLIFFYIHEIMEYEHEVEDIIENLKKQVIMKGEIKVILLREYAYFNKEINKFSFGVSLGEMVPVYENPPGCKFESSKELKGREARLTNDELRDYFKLAFENSLEMRKIFITFSHSSGFAINTNENPNADSPTKTNKVTIVNEDGLASFSANQSYRVVDKNVDIHKNVNSKLWIYDLVKILEEVLPTDDKIDLMLMVNCNMQVLDTLYQLKKKVKVLVASQTQFSYYGFHYAALISTLKKYKQISPQVLSEEAVKQFVEKYVHLIRDGIDKLSCNSLFAHDLAHVQQLMEVVNNVSDYLVNLVDDPVIREKINDLRNNQIADVSNYPGHYLNYEFVDFGGFLKALSKNLDHKRNRKLRVYYRMYKAVMKSLNIASFSGADYTVRDKDEQKKFNLSGISIYFPTSESVANRQKRFFGYLDMTKQAGYNIASKWDDFLQKLYDTSN